jgi:hypothetical protein
LGQTGSSAGGALASGNTVGFQAAYEV